MAAAGCHRDIGAVGVAHAGDRDVAVAARVHDLDAVTDGFYQRHHTQAHQNYMRGASEADRSQYVGDVLA